MRCPQHGSQSVGQALATRRIPPAFRPSIKSLDSAPFSRRARHCSRPNAAAVLTALFLTTGVTLAAEAVTSRPPKLTELFRDDVVARGRGVEVKRSQLDEAFVAHRAKLAAMGQPVSPAQQLIFTQILTNRVLETDRPVASEAAEKHLKEAREQAVSEEAFYRQLKAAGITPERYQQDVIESALAQAVIQRELNSTIGVSDAQVREFYNTGSDVLVRVMQADLEKMVKDPACTPSQLAQLKERIDEVRKANLAHLQQPERVRVSHVFFATRDRKTEEPLLEAQLKLKRQQIEKIRKRALEGEDFSKLVMEFSEDRGLKETKGEYTFTRDDPFAPEFKAAAFSLELGKLSDVVTSTLGYHVIKLLERIPAKKLELDKVAVEVKKFLAQQEAQRAMPEYLARLSKEVGVEILDAKYQTELSADLEPQKR